VSGREFIPNPAEIVLTARLCCLSTTSVTLGDSSGVKNKKQTVTQETNGHMKLSAWAKLQGLSYKTASRLWKAGQLPVLAEQPTTGTVILHAAPANEPPDVALYARVSLLLRRRSF